MASQHKKSLETCKICLDEAVKLYSVSDCSHSFCETCCIGYIEVSADSFKQAKCLEQGCGQPLDESKLIYTRVSRATKAKIAKVTAFQFLQKNPNFSACRASDCEGIFDKASPKCNICETTHCRKCLCKEHDGPCPVKNQRNQFRRLGFQQCPQCKVWVEKNKGCEFISCTCGTTFCYHCGMTYAKDQCRKKGIYAKQEITRQLFSSLQFKKYIDRDGICLFTLKFPLKILVIVIVTILSAPFLPLLACLLCIAATLFGPTIFIYLICMQVKDSTKKWGVFLVLLLMYPLLSMLCCLVAVIFFMLYLCCRNSVNHGAYGPLDLYISGLANSYLGMALCILSI